MTTWMSALAGGVLIGLAATLLLWLNGRVAGVSGIFNGAIFPNKGDVAWRYAFLIGLIVAGGAYMAFVPGAALPRTSCMSRPMWTVLLACAPPPSAAVAVTSTFPSRWLTVSTPSSSITAFSVGEPSGSVTVQRASWNDLSGAKSAVNGLTKSLALEYGPIGITVNAVPPGFIDTPMLRKSEERGLLGGTVEEHIDRTPVRRVGRPEDIAAACSFLISEEAGYITGQILGVNGGRNT